ncbi:MAG: molybdopterin cofactor-binding domain-containing protein [Steroidobacteraceae bacterium]
MGSLTRREVLRMAAGAAGGIALAIPFATGGAEQHQQTFSPGPMLRISKAQGITFIMPYVEMGQGVYTSVSMLLAEELEVELSQINLEHAPGDDVRYRNPLIGMQMTGGSTTIRAAWNPVRQLGATARVLLVQAAAAQWNVQPESCSVSRGVVSHAETGRRAAYADLADAAARLRMPSAPALKPASALRLVGKSLPRVDTPSKINGTAKFGIDARPPGVKFALISICPVLGGRLGLINIKELQNLRAVVQVVQFPDAFAIIATDTWGAKQAQVAARPQWIAPVGVPVTTESIAADLREAVARPGAPARVDSDSGTALEGTPDRVTAVYEQPFLAHAAMEPMNCTVHVQRGRCDVWVGTQVAGLARAVVARVTGLPTESVHIHNHLLGGGFGRRLEVDGIERAAQVAMAAEGPVQVIWTREEDIQHDMYRPYYVDKFDAAVLPDGLPAGWRHRIAGSSILTRYFPQTIRAGVDADAVDGATNSPYALKGIRVEWSAVEPQHVPTAFWRGVGSTRGTFVMESFIDELASRAGRDPLEYRLAMLGANDRAARVLNAAAERAGWHSPVPKGRGRGIALCNGFGSYIAQVVEAGLDEYGSVVVTRVTCVVDCGPVVNPDIVSAQIESGIVFGLAAALFGRITLKDGRVEQSNFSDYRILRMNETPAINVFVNPTGMEPGGIGEPGTACVMPALANALFAATGKRVRRLPIADQLTRS